MTAGVNHRGEIDRLLSLERGNTLDLAMRLLGVPAGSFMFYAYNGTLMAFYWSVGYVLCYGLYRLYIERLGPKVTYRQQITAHLLIVLLTLSFLWMPSLLMVSPDRNLYLVGAALVGAQLMHLVHRGDTPLFLIFGVTGAVFATMISLLITIIPQLKSSVAIAGILISWFSLIFYLGQSLLAARARILAEKAARAQNAQSQKLAALGQLAGGIAHDFNNILTAISGNLELYGVLKDQAEKDEVVAAAHLSSQRAAKIVSQILIYARKTPVHLQVVDANVPLTSLTVLIEHLVPANIHFTVEPLSQPQMVRIDPDQFLTALMNLSLNSVDAIDETGSITLRVLLEDLQGETKVAGGSALKPGRYVIYEVADTGTGIPKEMLKSVVDPFYTTKPVGKGTGLGLSMAVSIAQSVEGGLEIDSSDAGTTIRIYVPGASQGRA